jgi:adenylyl-sulfate kinase
MSAHVLWFTGLSGSGKTTLAGVLKVKLEQRGNEVKIIDGDTVREKLHRHLGFSPEDICENNRLVAQLCQKYVTEYDFLLVPVIAPFRRSRLLVREQLSPFYSEIYVKASVDACIERDVKGLYKKALAGKIDNFIGVSAEVPYEPPEKAELIVDTENVCVTEAVERLLAYAEGLTNPSL